MKTIAILLIAATTLAGCIVVPRHGGGHGHHHGHGFSQSGHAPHYHSGPRHYRR